MDFQAARKIPTRVVKPLTKGPHPLVSHTLAALMAIAATAIRVALDPWLGAHAPLLLNVLAIIIAALVLDRFSSVTALVVSTVLIWFFVLQPGAGADLSGKYVYAMAAFIVAGALISLMGEGLHRLAAATLAERRLYRSAFELVEVGLAHLDPHSARFVQVNPRLSAMTGHSREELLGMTLYDLESAGSEADRRWRLDELVSGPGSTARSEKVWRRSDGRDIVVEVAKTLVRDSHGRPAVVLVAANDITVLRQTNRALAQANEGLEHFARIVGHDLKEPLRGIHHHLTVLHEETSCGHDEEAGRRVTAAQRLVERLKLLLDGALQYAQSAHVLRAPCSMEEVVVEALENVAGEVQRRGAVVEREGSLPVVECDRQRLVLVFQNLVQNALKYNTSQPPRVWVGARDGAFYVRDNGIGIPPQRREEIFDVFRRLHGREEYGGGTGAGLAIVRRIIEGHGGRIWVGSEPGVGSTFWFTLGSPAGGAGTKARGAVVQG